MTLPLEKKVAMRAVDCYNKHTDYKSVQKCLEVAQTDVQGVGKSVNGEFQALQSSIQACQQSVAQRLQPRAADAQNSPDMQTALQAEYEAGVKRCIKDAEPMLPDI